MYLLTRVPVATFGYMNRVEPIESVTDQWQSLYRLSLIISQYICNIYKF